MPNPLTLPQTTTTRHAEPSTAGAHAVQVLEGCTDLLAMATAPWDRLTPSQQEDIRTALRDTARRLA